MNAGSCSKQGVWPDKWPTSFNKDCAYPTSDTSPLDCNHIIPIQLSTQVDVRPETDRFASTGVWCCDAVPRCSATAKLLQFDMCDNGCAISEPLRHVTAQCTCTWTARPCTEQVHRCRCVYGRFTPRSARENLAYEITQTLSKFITATLFRSLCSPCYCWCAVKQQTNNIKRHHA